MRSAWLLILFAMTNVASAQDQLSNPAFLGIGMSDQQPPGPTGGGGGPCTVTTVTRGSGAKAAGIQFGDRLRAIQGTATPNCDAVLKAVQAHVPGDVIAVDLYRNNTAMTVKATLLSRDEILRRRLVGSPVATTELFAVDEDRIYDLSANRGKTTIVGWFDPQCTSCKQVFTKLADWSRKQVDKPGAQPLPLAVVREPDADPKTVARGSKYKSTAATFDVPLALASPDVFDEFTINDRDRVHFTVVDCRGIVQYVAPVVSNGVDTDAAMDELFAAAEQAARLAIKR